MLPPPRRPSCRCGLCDPAGGQPHQAQPGGDRGRAGHRVYEDPEHVQDHRDQVQAQRAFRRDHCRRQEDQGPCGPFITRPACVGGRERGGLCITNLTNDLSLLPPPLLQTVVTLENGKLVQKQCWDGKETNIEREISDGKLIAVRA